MVHFELAHIVESFAHSPSSPTACPRFCTFLKVDKAEPSQVPVASEAVTAPENKKIDDEEGEETALTSLSGPEGEAAVPAGASKDFSARGPGAPPVESSATEVAAEAEAEAETATAPAPADNDAPVAAVVEATASQSDPSRRREGGVPPLPPLSSSLALAPVRRSSRGGGGSFSMGESATSLFG